MKKYSKLLAMTAMLFFSPHLLFASECQFIENPYSPNYDTEDARKAVFDHNGKAILETLNQNKIETISPEDLQSLLNCMRSSAKLGDPIAALALTNMLIQLAKPEDLTEAYLVRIIANTQQKYDVMSDLKRTFHNLGPDNQVLEKAFSDKTEADFIEIFSTESHLAVNDIEDLQMAFRDIWDNMPALSEYLRKNSKKGSVTEMLGIITLQESSINEFKNHENNLDNHLIIADYVMDYLEYRPSYDFTKAVYETALTQGTDSQKAHAKSQLQKLDTFFTQKHQ